MSDTAAGDSMPDSNPTPLRDLLVQIQDRHPEDSHLVVCEYPCVDGLNATEALARVDEIEEWLLGILDSFAVIEEARRRAEAALAALVGDSDVE